MKYNAKGNNLNSKLNLKNICSDSKIFSNIKVHLAAQKPEQHTP